MSLQKFSATLRTRASSSVLDRLATESSAAYTSSTGSRANKFIRAASILEDDSRKFGTMGKKQGQTRLTVTEDSLGKMLNSFGIIYGEEGDAVKLYLTYLQEKVSGYKNSHFEFYDAAGEKVIAAKKNTPLGEFIPTLAGGIIAVRGTNFSHAHTLTHITRFLQYAGAGSLTGLSLKEAEKAVSEVYERGHIIATTTGRQMVSIGGIQQQKDILDEIVQLSVYLDIASSSLAKPKYANVLASIQKDFTETRMFMNLEFQPIRDTDSTGNQDAADITRGLQAISSLKKLITNYTKYPSGKLEGTVVAQKTGIAANVLLDLANKIAKYEIKIDALLQKYKAAPIGYAAALKSSKSMIEHVVYSTISHIKGEKTKSTKVKHGNVPVASVSLDKSKKTTLASQIKPLVTARKKELDNLLKVAGTVRKSNTEQSTASLEALLRSRLALQIRKNMGTGSAKNVLNYRTGRLAESASIERLSSSRAGMVTVFYNYMRNPYGTFSDGGAQEFPKSRDPKLLISKSIREIGASLVSNRMRAVLV